MKSSAFLLLRILAGGSVKIRGSSEVDVDPVFKEAVFALEPEDAHTPDLQGRQVGGAHGTSSDDLLHVALRAPAPQVPVVPHPRVVRIAEAAPHLK